jgi:hypothetical protein
VGLKKPVPQCLVSCMPNQTGLNHQFLWPKIPAKHWQLSVEWVDIPNQSQTKCNFTNTTPSRLHQSLVYIHYICIYIYIYIYITRNYIYIYNYIYICITIYIQNRYWYRFNVGNPIIDLSFLGYTVIPSSQAIFLAGHRVARWGHGHPAMARGTAQEGHCYHDLRGDYPLVV